jgi:hypothetical protein
MGSADRLVTNSGCYLSNLPPATSRKRLVYLAKIRWRIERDYQELKGELGLDHFEGRTWDGFHHHTACVAAAHAFLTLERVRFPPQGTDADLSGLSPAAPDGTTAPDRDMSALRSTRRARRATESVTHVIR